MTGAAGALTATVASAAGKHPRQQWLPQKLREEMKLISPHPPTTNKNCATTASTEINWPAAHVTETSLDFEYLTSSQRVEHELLNTKVDEEKILRQNCNQMILRQKNIFL